MRGLSDRIALVTGATGLIGKAITCRLAAEGVTVVMASREAARAERVAATIAAKHSARLVPLEMDLSDRSSIDSALNWLDKEVGSPSLLIANASQRERDVLRATNELSHDSFNRLVEVDVAGHFLCARDIVSRLCPGKPASIVFVSSIYALVGVDHSIYPPGMSATTLNYAVVKAGLLGMTSYLAAMWGRQGVRVNTVVAGGVHAPDRQPGGFVANYAEKTMLGRMAEVDEIASTVAFLASDEASYITGAHIVVDGGYSAW